MPEFSAGSIWVERDGQRLDEYGEKVKLSTPQAEAKSCFVELSGRPEKCEIRWNYQFDPANLGGVEPSGFYVSCAVLKSTPEEEKNPHAMKENYSFYLVQPTSIPGFTFKPFGLDLSTVQLLDVQNSFSLRPCLMKTVITAISIESAEAAGEGAAGLDTRPGDPWQDRAKEGKEESFLARIVRPGFIAMTGAYQNAGFKYKVHPCYPQLSAVLQTVFDRSGHPPPLTRPVHKPVPSGGQVGSLPQPSAEAQEEEERRSRHRAELERLSTLLREAEDKLQGNEERKRQMEEGLTPTNAKRLRIKIPAGEEVQIQLDVGGSDKAQAELPVAVKKEPGEEEG